MTISGIFNWTQVLHDNSGVFAPPPAGTTNDKGWGTLGLNFSYAPVERWEITYGATYDVFNKNYEETFAVTVGAGYAF
ncbi:MAG: hypothetical protein HC904_10610 [Blastochloris sp.]|nr:hypothetical protein [Blastochloris sp.]